MFDNLSEKLNLVFKRFKGAGKLSEKDIVDGMKYVRIALLEADVNYRVTKELITGVSERALGHEVIDSLTPGQQVVKIVSEEMSKIMGGQYKSINFNEEGITSLMLIGLQGVGKTTTVAKIASYLKDKGKKSYLVSVDVYRPAAITQLEILAKSLKIAMFNSNPNMNVLDICREAKIEANRLGCDVIILDTAGRLHIDQNMMEELYEIKKLINPSEILLTADAMTGQDAVNIAKSFDSKLNISGIILTKMDGDARGGAALSMNFVTGKPIKFMGTGEKVEDFEPFHPERVTSRILGMGDVLTIVDKARKTLSKESANDIEKKFKTNTFSLEDFREQMINIRKMGSFKDLLGLVPGFKKIKQIKKLDVEDGELVKIEAIINSMTPSERKSCSVMNGSRRKRIAIGSGTKVQDVNRLIKNYLQVTKMMKNFNKKDMGGFVKSMLPS